MPVNLGELVLHPAEKVLVVLERKVRVDTALKKDAGSAKVDRLLDLLAELVPREQVAFRVTRPPVERAELALVDTDVGVVDVAVDDVGDDLRIVQAIAHRVRRSAELEKLALAQEHERVLLADSRAADGAAQDLLNSGSISHSIFFSSSMSP